MRDEGLYHLIGFPPYHKMKQAGYGGLFDKNQTQQLFWIDRLKEFCPIYGVD
jgi:hypothetical protein